MKLSNDSLVAVFLRGALLPACAQPPQQKAPPRLPIASALTKEALRDHAEGILLAIADDIEHAQTADEEEQKSKGHGPRTIGASSACPYGRDRVLEGFSVNDTMAEYRALRASVMPLWAGEQTGAQDPAMYAAKQSGRNRYCFFTTEMRNAAWRRRTRVAELRQAVMEQQLRVLYQPIVELEHGSVVGAEAQLYWQHPEKDLLPAHEFSDLAEEAGLAQEVLEVSEAMLLSEAPGSMASGIIASGHALGFKVIAEGVENEDQEAQPRSLGCDYAQGFHFFSAMDAAGFKTLLERVQG